MDLPPRSRAFLPHHEWRSRVRFVVVRVSVLSILLLTPIWTNAQQRPNILLIVSDDQGYADAGFQGSEDIPTPHLNELAASGIRFTNGYVTHAYCSPSRAGMLAGRYQQRFGHERNPFYDRSNHREGLPLTETLLPERLQAAGYVTGWIGKWHLGVAPEFAPERRGFSETLGFLAGAHHYQKWQSSYKSGVTAPIERNGSPVEVTEHLTTAFGREATDFIHRHDDKPWFLYLAFNAPHTPMEPPAEWLARFAAIKDPLRRKYVAQMSLMDEAIGEALTALRESGQTGRTLVFFFSDNGGKPKVNGSDNSPLRGEKGTPYEGGIRVPFLMAWPGRLAEGVVEERPVSSMDVFATSLALAGEAMSTDRVYDSVNLMPFLTGEKTGAPHERLYWRNGDQFALREGNWKLVREGGRPAELYNLERDLGETTDLARTHPEILARLMTELSAWDKELIDPVFPGDTGHQATARKNLNKAK